MRKHTSGAVTLIAVSGAVLALSFCRTGVPVHAQGFVTPTPLPGPVATQQSADATLNNVSAQSAEADRLDAQAAEIRRNIAAQAAQAAQAYADARAATAAQNAAAIGEAIGRGEANLAQLKSSVDGALNINDKRSELVNSLIISTTQLAADLNQARSELANLKTINANLQNANNTIMAQRQADAKASDVLSLALPFIGFLLLIALLAAVLWLRQHPRTVTVTMPASGGAAAQAGEAEEVIEGEVRQD